MTVNQKSSNILFVAKCFAVWMIVTAHCYTVPATAPYALTITSSVLQLFSIGGVGIFFFIAGYFLCFNTQPPLLFWKKKLKSLIIPWVITGTAVWLYTVLRKEGLAGLSPVNWLQWIGGIRTYLWYMTVLVVLYALFLQLAKYRFFHIVLPLLSLLSYFTYSLTYPYFWSWGGNYLNVFSWALVFWCGYWIGKKQWLETLLAFSRKYCLLLLATYTILLSLLLAFRIPCNYGMPTYLLYLFITLFTVLAVSSLLCNTQWIRRIGRDSFPIYLLHMPIAGVVTKLGNRVNSMFVLLLRPVLVIAVVELFLILVNRIIKRYPRFRFVNTLIGLR